MTDRLAILLPPSEGKAPGGSGPAWDPGDGRFCALAPQRTVVVRALAAAGGGSGKLLGVGGRHLAHSQEANLALATGAATLPAGQRYTGVVYDHLSLRTLTPAARTKAGASIVVLSGLLGAVGIDDPAPDYRLKMGARLAPMGGLARWWRPALSEVLGDWLRGRTVIDLLPNEHAAAWAPSPNLDVVRVRFVERTGAVAGHDAKAAKGLLVRYLLSSRAGPARALSSFAHDRFHLDLI